MQPPQYSTPRLCDFAPGKYDVSLMDPTLDDVARYSLGKLQSLLIQESKVEGKLEEIETTVRDYRMRQKMLMDKIFLYRAILAPVRKLSTEVLTMIFGFVFASSPDDIAHVGSVCTQWRNATLSTTLWSHIVVPREGHALSNKVILFNERSQPHPLKITYGQSIDTDRRWFTWEVLLSTAHRWTSVSLTFDDCKSASLRIPALKAAPSLKALSVTIRRQSVYPLDEGKYGFDLHDAAKTPLLRSLTLSTHTLPRRCLWFTRLTKLHITDTFSDANRWGGIGPMRGNNVLQLLTGFPNLEDFSFEGEKSVSWLSSRYAIVDRHGWEVKLCRLRRLLLRCHYTVGYRILSYLKETESLEDVTLNLLPRFDSLTQDRLEHEARDFLNQSPRIRSLSVYGLNHSEISEALLHGLRELEELHLSHISGVGNSRELHVIAHSLLQSVKPSDSWCAPRLSKISIDANWNDVPFDRLALVVEIRHSSHIRFGTPCLIQTLIVNGQNLLDGAAPGGMVEYKHPQRFCRSQESSD